jgi:hypothetical protein
MANGTLGSLGDAVETFSAPIEQLIIALGQGISQAQQAMDLNSIKTQETLDTDPIVAPYGLQATWYQFPRVDLQLKLSLAISEDQSSSSSNAASSSAASRAVPVGLQLIDRPVRLIGQPVSASYQTHFNYDAQAASVITVSIVPVPSPAPGDRTTVVPRMQQADVQAAALASAAGFRITTGANGQKVPADKDASGNALRLDINFNPAARLWYVLQYAPSNSAVPAVVVAVDDGTGSVRIIRTAS